MSIIIEAARDFALKAHGGQRYGDHPYEKHLSDVVQVLFSFQKEYHFDEHVIAAGWLHDCVEDTPVKAMDIYHHFGHKVGDITFAVTNENGRNRKERTVKTMLKVREAGVDALAVKLADRIANGRFSKENGSSQYKMYCREYPFIRWFLKEDRLPLMWQELDSLFLKG